MSTTTIRADAITRCRDAYKANGIEWDRALEKLTEKKLLETAQYWERKAEELSTPASLIVLAEYMPRAVANRISTIAGFPKHHCSSGGRTEAQTAAMKKMNSH